VNLKGTVPISPRMVGERMAEGAGGSIIMVSEHPAGGPHAAVIPYAGPRPDSWNALTEGFARAFRHNA